MLLLNTSWISLSQYVVVAICEREYFFASARNIIRNCRIRYTRLQPIRTYQTPFRVSFILISPQKKNHASSLRHEFPPVKISYSSHSHPMHLPLHHAPLVWGRHYSNLKPQASSIDSPTDQHPWWSQTLPEKLIALSLITFDRRVLSHFDIAAVVAAQISDHTWHLNW